jgi:D-alanyl-D-alanine dipeptidase
VYLRDVDPTIVQDIRYAGSHNFVGRPIRGYLGAECILSASAANALREAQRMLATRKLSLIVWDCYRPKRAVDDFLQWSRDPARTEMKAKFYPRTDERKLFALGYLATRSAHSRGSTVDLGVVPVTHRHCQIPHGRCGHVRRRRANDSRMERSISALVTTVWMVSAARRTPRSAGPPSTTARC